jgi:hypothetical protein
VPALVDQGTVHPRGHFEVSAFSRPPVRIGPYSVSGFVRNECPLSAGLHTSAERSGLPTPEPCAVSLPAREAKSRRDLPLAAWARTIASWFYGSHACNLVGFADLKPKSRSSLDLPERKPIGRWTALLIAF